MGGYAFKIRTRSLPFQNHLLPLQQTAVDQHAAEINAAGYLLAGPVLRVPLYCVPTGIQLLIHENDFAARVEHVPFPVSGLSRLISWGFDTSNVHTCPSPSEGRKSELNQE